MNNNEIMYAIISTARYTIVTEEDANSKHVSVRADVYCGKGGLSSVLK